MQQLLLHLMGGVC